MGWRRRRGVAWKEWKWICERGLLMVVDASDAGDDYKAGVAGVVGNRW